MAGKMSAKEDIAGGSRRDLSSQFRSVEELLGSKRAQLTTRLQRMRFGEEISIELVGGQRVKGFLRGCNGVRVVLIDGTSLAVAAIRSVSIPDGEVSSDFDQR
jgi:hypothetical protein